MVLLVLEGNNPLTVAAGELLYYCGIAGIILGFMIFSIGIQRVVSVDVIPKLVEDVIEEKLRVGKCGVCEYGVEGLTPEADGCVVCPECGAAWRLPVNSADA